jgi:hypothetical protein
MKAGDLVFGAIGTAAWIALWCSEVGAVIGLFVMAFAALCVIAR